MITRYGLPLLAIAGVIFAVVFVRAGNKPVPASQPVAQPAQAPFDSYIAGAGIVEASTENISVGTVVPGIVRELYVKIGDKVKAGSPLFKIDDRDLQADLLTKKAAVESAKAGVAVDEASLADQQSMYVSRKEAGAGLSKDELERRRFAVLEAEAKLTLSKAAVDSANAALNATQIFIDRTTVKALVDCTVLQIKIRVGEYASLGALATPLMLVGDVDTLSVRVDIDENDAWRLKEGGRARAFMRGNRDLATDLKFVRIEPYVLPKRSLTGESTERVDTRVLQVIYSFPKDALRAYVGQQMDVFIDAPPIGNAKASILQPQDGSR